MWSNFHMHSNYCDGKAELIEYVSTARKLGMASIGFSSHAPLPFTCTWCMKADNFQSYQQSIENIKALVGEIEIYKGLEVDFIPGIITPHQFETQLDYTIGSIHFVDTFSDGTHWEIDGLHTLFLSGLENIFRGNIRAAVTRYFELTREMIRESPPTIVGHLDKIKIQNVDGKFYSESDPWYQEEIEKTLTVIAGSNVIVEVNTRGVYQKKSKTTYPSPWILELIHKKNIPITLNSDAHHPSDIINQFPETVTMLSDIGFKYLTVLHEQTWKPFSFNTHGIIY